MRRVQLISFGRWAQRWLESAWLCKCCRRTRAAIDLHPAVCVSLPLAIRLHTFHIHFAFDFSSCPHIWIRNRNMMSQHKLLASANSNRIFVANVNIARTFCFFSSCSSCSPICYSYASIVHVTHMCMIGILCATHRRIATFQWPKATRHQNRVGKW